MKQFVAETYYLLLNKKPLLNKRVLCSFSGGQDSTIVFFSLFHRKRQTINLVYFNHFWQSQNFQASKGIFYLSFNLKVPYSIIISTCSLGNENRSRNWRKKKLFRFSILQQTSLVVTGHTQTDNLETNLINLIRGTSSKGVSFQNFFGAKQQETFYKAQNYPSYCFYPRVFSISFLVLKLISQPKKFSFVKTIRFTSKIFLLKVNLVAEKSVLPFLQKKFVIKPSPITEKLQSFKQYKLNAGETVFTPKVLSISNWSYLGLTKNFSKEIYINNKLIGSLQINWREYLFKLFLRRAPLIRICQNSPKTLFFSVPLSIKMEKIYPFPKNEIFWAKHSLLPNLTNLGQEMNKRYFWDSQSTKSHGTSSNFWFSRQEEFNLYEKLQKNKVFSELAYSFPSTPCSKTEVFGKCKGKYTRKSNSFCFLKFCEHRTIQQKTPLKNQTRLAVSKVAKTHTLPIFHDLTNFSSQSSRNKIRHIVFPLIGYLFQKKVDFSFTQFFSSLITETWHSEKSCQKFYFLLDFFSLPNVDDSNCSPTNKKFPFLKSFFLLPETKYQKGYFSDNRWRFFDKKKETLTFATFLLLYICKTSPLNFQLYIIKKLIRDYTERELSFNQILTIQKNFTK